jgi:hypothetical protein
MARNDGREKNAQLSSYHVYRRFPQIRQNKQREAAFGQASYYIVKNLPEHLVLSYDYNALSASPGVWHISYFSRNPQVPQPFLPAEMSLHLAEQLTSNLVTLVHDDTDLLGTLLSPNLTKIVTNPAGGAKNTPRSDLLKRLVLVKSTTP